jgi:hypothetical protein
VIRGRVSSDGFSDMTDAHMVRVHFLEDGLGGVRQEAKLGREVQSSVFDMSLGRPSTVPEDYCVAAICRDPGRLTQRSCLRTVSQLLMRRDH